MAVCVGCKRDSKDLPEYDGDNRVEEDGTYADGKFVCTACYVYLVDLGLDVGPPEDVQGYAIKHVLPLNE